MNRKSLGALIVVAIVAGALWRFGPWSGDAARAKAPAIPVTAMEVHARNVPLFQTGIGTVQAYNTVTIRARVDGELMKVAFREGQMLKKGDLLAQIDSRPYQAALHTAEAALVRDQATLANAKRDLARVEDVAAKGYASRQQLDSQTATVAALSASVKVDEAGVENARVQLSYTTIVSPLDGRAGVRLIDQGNIIHANDTTGLVVITQTQPIAAMFTLPQSALPAVAAAQAQAPLKVTAFSRDETVELGEGALELIDNQIDPSTGTIRLKAYFPNADNKLWPGQFINARLTLGVRDKSISVPAQVVQRGAQGPYAYVIKADNTVEVRTVELGPQYRGEILINNGLRDGEKVVVDGQLRLQPGTTVKITETPPKTGGGGASQEALAK